VAGDVKYGDAGFTRELRKLGLKRLFLHAHFVAFRDEERQREIEVSAPLAPDLRKLIQQLE
jgi:23S rRNA pseudouridine955/2504/2580 synthase